MPIIATLPSGALLANSSSRQCIMSNEEEMRDRGEDNIAVIMPDSHKDAPRSDEFLRVHVPYGVLKVKGDDNFHVYPVYQLHNAYYDKHKNKYTGDDLKFKQEGYALVAIVFRPDEDYTTADFVGVWPEVGLDGNTVLNGSCWTSISPNSDLNGLV